MGIYTNNSRYQENVGQHTVNMTNPSWTDITALADQWNENRFFILMVNGNEWWSINYNPETKVISKDFITIDCLNEVIDTNGETVNDLVIKLFANMPFMAFNKVDAYQYNNNGVVNVYDGINYQLYPNGQVFTQFPYIEYQEQAQGPVLSNFWLGLNGTEVTGNGGVVGSLNQENKYVWQWSGTLSQAITASTNYNYSIEGSYNGSGFGDNSGGQFTWESQMSFWRLNNGPSIIRIVPDGGDQTATQAQIIVIYDPSWQPGPSSAPDLNTLWVGYGNNPTVNMVDINNASIGGSVNNNKFMWNIEGVTLPEAFQAQNYNHNFVAGNISTSGGGTAYWVDETDFHAWIIDNGALVIQILPQSDVNVNLHIEFDPNWQPSSGPALTAFKAGASQEGDMVNMSGISVSGNQDGNYIRYDLENVNFGTAITENNSYLFNVALDNGNNIGFSANASWVNDGVGLGWAFHPGNSPIYEVFITVTSQSDTVASKIEVKYNPNWQPPTNNLNLLRITDNSTSNVLYENTSLDIAKNNNMWVLNGAQFTSSVGENTPLNIYIETSNGTQAGYSNTATLVSGTPTYYSITASQGPVSETRLFGTGNNVYDIQLLGN